MMLSSTKFMLNTFTIESQTKSLTKIIIYSVSLGVCLGLHHSSLEQHAVIEPHILLFMAGGDRKWHRPFVGTVWQFFTN